MPDIGEDDQDAGYRPNAAPAPKAATPLPPPRPPGVGADDEDAGLPPQPAADPNAIVERTKPWSLVPAGWDAQGNPHFDSDAGVLGFGKHMAQSVGSGLGFAHDAMTGGVDLNSQEAIRRSMDMASLGATDAAVLTAKNILSPPAAEALRTVGKAGYNGARDMGVVRGVGPTVDLARQTQQDLYADSLPPALAGKAHAVLDQLQDVPDGAVGVPLSSLIAARRRLGKISATHPDANEAEAARRAQSSIDDYIINPDPASVVSGPAEAAGKAFADANGNYAAYKRSGSITKGEDTAQLNAAAANSGQNVGNSIRQRAKAIITNPKLAYGYSPEELAALRSVVDGTATSNTARLVGNYLGGGGGMHSWITSHSPSIIAGAAGLGGIYEAGPWGAAAAALPPIVGNLAKRTDAALTAKRMQAADEMVRSHSPLSRQQQAAVPATDQFIPTARAAALRTAGVSSTDNAPQMTPEEAVQYIKSNPGDTFARGGSVKSKNHDELVARLMDASEKAKTAAKRDTKAILNVPDNTVAKALAVAQKAI